MTKLGTSTLILNPSVRELCGINPQTKHQFWTSRNDTVSRTQHPHSSCKSNWEVERGLRDRLCRIAPGAIKTTSQIVPPILKKTRNQMADSLQKWNSPILDIILTTYAREWQHRFSNRDTNSGKDKTHIVSRAKPPWNKMDRWKEHWRADCAALQLETSRLRTRSRNEIL